MHYRFEHEFEIDPKRYWEIFFDAKYNDDLYDALHIKDREVLEQKEEAGVLKRVVRLHPKTEIPSVFKAVIKDMSYTEIDYYRKERSAMDVIIEPAMMKNKFDMKGVYSVSPVGDGSRCKRVFEGDVKVSIMLLGGQIEKYMIEQIRQSYDTAARVTREWIAKAKSPTT